MFSIDRHMRNGQERMELSSQAQQELIGVTCRGFGPGMSEREVLDHVLPVDFLYIARVDSQIAGFASLELFETYAYFAGTVVDPAFQGRGIYGGLSLCLLRETLSHSFPLLTTRTQNPVVEYTLRKALKLLHKGGELQGYEIRREHCPGIYGRMLTRDRPFCKDGVLNNEYDVLNYPAGDAFKLNFLISK